MRICMLGAEAAPYAVVGEVAQVVRGLTEELIRAGADVRVLTPFYAPVRHFKGVKKILDLGPTRIGERTYQGHLHADLDSESPRNYFVGCRELFDRKGIYQDPLTGEDHADNFERFDFFCLASLDALQKMDWQPDIIHCHDAHTALVPAYLKLLRMGQSFFSRISTVLTLYDLSYHGQYPGDRFKLTSLPQELFYPMGPFEYYGKLSTLKGGICYADLINTVSHQYAREIQTKEFGCGLEEVIKRRKDALFGVLNGIDTSYWDPEMDPLIHQTFSIENLEGKKSNKRYLQHLCGLPAADVPLVGLISRLPEQDGLDLFLDAADSLLELDCQWVLVSDKLRSRRQQLEELTDLYPDRIRFRKNEAETFTHQFHAGCDMLLMPSRSQPCGLNQLYSMRYGTVPIVRHAGGLVETVQQYDPETGTGHGLKIYSLETEELIQVVREALRLWREPSSHWTQIVKNAMNQDFSWRKSARQYLELYRRIVH